MEKSFGLVFILRRTRHKKAEELPIYIRITVDGGSCEVSTKRKIESSKWNASAGRMIGKDQAVKAFNAYLDTLQQKVFEVKRQIIELDLPLTCVRLKNRLLGVEAKLDERMVLEIFGYHNKQMSQLVGKKYVVGTLKRFETSLRHTKAFIKFKYGVNDFPISKLDFEFFNAYGILLLIIFIIGVVMIYDFKTNNIGILFRSRKLASPLDLQYTAGMAMVVFSLGCSIMYYAGMVTTGGSSWHMLSDKKTILIRQYSSYRNLWTYNQTKTT